MADKFYAGLGKLFIALIVIGLLATGGYYLRTRYLPELIGGYLVPLSAPPTATPAPIASLTPAASPSPVPSGTIPLSPKKISAGIKTQFFVPYSILILPGWIDVQTSGIGTNELKVTKGQYIFVISQAAGGGGSCLYPGDSPQPMAQTFTSFVQITGSSSNLRRGTNDNTAFTICEQKNTGFTFPTTVGYITYSTPSSPDSTSLSEMDSMIASITK